MNAKQKCQRCSAFDYLSTVDGKRVCSKCATHAFWSRMPDPLKRSFKEIIE